MAEKVVIGNAELWHGDCREVLPLLTLPDAALVTDPPYGLAELWQGGGGSKRTSWRFDPDEAKGWDGATVEAVEQMAVAFRESVVWGGNYYKLEPSRCWLVWDKKQNDNWTTGQAEMAWTNLDRPVRVFRFAQCEQASEGPKYHPTQKPLALMAWCLKWIKAPTVLDPFMGSGTTGVACAMHRRGFVGIERERKYFDMACERIEAAQRQGSLIPLEQTPVAEQQAMDL
jgi:site-specific DNA-methyltransferase (adenine-specific)